MRATIDANAKQSQVEEELSLKPHLKEARALEARKTQQPRWGSFQYPELDCLSVNSTVNYLSSPFGWTSTA